MDISVVRAAASYSLTSAISDSSDEDGYMRAESSSSVSPILAAVAACDNGRMAAAVAACIYILLVGI